MSVPTWFNYKVYMTNKLAQLEQSAPDAGWTEAKLLQTFSDAGFKGPEGAFAHFEMHGQAEDVAPNAFFNANEYYRAKAIQLTGKTDAELDDMDVAVVRQAIKDSGMNAWSHYEGHGSAEGVNPSNEFNTSAYLDAKLKALQASEPNAGWDMPKLNQALKDAGLSALEHFMLYAGTPGEVPEGLTEEGKIPDSFLVKDENKVTPGGSGATQSLTTGVDTIKGTAGNDIFNAVLTSGSTSTYTAGDSVDGNGGKDTFNLTASTDISSNLTTIKNMTDVNLTVATSAAFKADMSDFSGVKTFNVKANAGTVGLSGVSKDAAVNINNLKTVATIDFSDVAGSDDTAIVGLTGLTSAAGVSVAGVEKLTLKTLGTDSVLGNVTIADTKTLTISGHDDLTISTLAGSAKLTTLVIDNDKGFVSILADKTTGNALTKIDATNNDGGVEIDLTAQTTDTTLSFTGGDGDDTLIMKYAYLKATDSLKGGAGTNTLVLDGPLTNTASLADINKAVSGFEVLALTTNAANTITVSDFTNGITDFLLYGQSSDGTATFTGALSTTTFEIDFSTTGSTGYAKLDVTNKAFDTKSDLTIDNQLATTAAVITAATFTGVDELNLHSTGEGGTNTVTTLTIDDGKTLVIDGNVDLTLTVANSLKVNAETFEGDLKLTTTAAKAMQIIGGEGDDTITIAGGAVSDTFDGKAGGNDTLVVTAATAVATTVITSVQMTTFENADAGDILKFGTVGSFDKVAVDVSSAGDNLLTALGLATKGGTAGVIKYFTFGNDTYVVADMSTDAALSSVDVVVKLAGTDLDLSKAIFNDTADTLTFA